MAVEFNDAGQWTEVTFSETITAADVMDVIRRALEIERQSEVTPDRLLDLGPGTTLDIGFGDIANVMQLRRAANPANPIRTAVVVHSAAQQGYARMFQTVNDHPMVTVGVFTDRLAAEAWLREPRAR